MNRCIYCGAKLTLTNEYLKCIKCQNETIIQGKCEIANAIDYHESEIKRLKERYKLKYGVEYVSIYQIYKEE